VLQNALIARMGMVCLTKLAHACQRNTLMCRIPNALIAKLIVYRVLHHLAHSVMDSISKMKMIKHNAFHVRLATARLALEKVTKNNFFKLRRGREEGNKKLKQKNSLIILFIETATSCGTCSDGYELSSKSQC